MNSPRHRNQRHTTKADYTGTKIIVAGFVATFMIALFIILPVKSYPNERSSFYDMRSPIHLRGDGWIAIAKTIPTDTKCNRWRSLVDRIQWLDKSDLVRYMHQFTIWVQDLGLLWGPLIFTIVYIVVTVLFLPAVFLSLAAGFIYGTILGSVIVQLGSTVGACASFILGKAVLRDFTSKIVESYPLFAAIDKAIAFNSWKIVTLLRLSPITPFNVLNYGLAFTRITFWDYTWSSTIGMIPQTILFVYLGTAVKNLSDLQSVDSTEQNPMSELLFMTGIIVTIISAVLITIIAGRAIRQELEAAQIKKVELNMRKVTIV